MTSKYVNVQARKDRILEQVINGYIETVCPVSSSYLARKFIMDLSPATIRNILAELEQEGFLTHPHTSAGRIPTQLGYRYYVDNLMNEIKLLEAEKDRIRAEYKRKILELEALLEETSRIVSDTIHYASIVSVDGWSNKLFCKGMSFILDYMEQDDVDKMKNILFALDEKERLLKIINHTVEERINILIGNELECSDINSCSLVIATYKTKKGLSGRISVLGPTRMNYEKVVSTLDYFSDLMEEVLVDF